MTPREQGDFGELSAMEWLASLGAQIYVPFGHSPDVDVVAAVGGRLLTFEVKTSGSQDRRGHWLVRIATLGGNQSWSGLVKHFDPSRCDFLMAVVGDGRRWCIPTSAIGARNQLTLGGPKYSEYEVEPGRRFISNPSSGSDRGGADRSTLSAPLGGSVGAGEPSEPVKFVPSAEWVRIPPPPSGAGDLPAPSLGKYRTKAASNRSVTIPKGCFEEADLSVGDRFAVQACEQGTVLLTRIEEPAAPPSLLGPN